MGLTIKSAEAETLARELADLTGESVADAVTASVRERLDRVRRERVGSVSQRLLDIGRAAAPLFADRDASSDATASLYDDAGLPR